MPTYMTEGQPMYTLGSFHHAGSGPGRKACHQKCSLATPHVRNFFLKLTNDHMDSTVILLFVCTEIFQVTNEKILVHTLCPWSNRKYCGRRKEGFFFFSPPPPCFYTLPAAQDVGKGTCNVWVLAFQTGPFYSRVAAKQHIRILVRASISF